VTHEHIKALEKLIEAAKIVHDSYWNSTDGVIRGIYDLGVALHYTQPTGCRYQNRQRIVDKH